MKLMPSAATRRSPQPVEPAEDTRLVAWKSLVVGQDDSLDRIWPYIDVWEGGLGAERRPAGAFLFVGSTGSGKTHCVESLAQVLHDTERNVLRIDCGEMGENHEVAKLIGAPPGYLGHRETQPLLSAAKLSNMRSKSSNLALILFDEIEKGSGALHRLLLSILDKGVLTVGDNSVVNFQDTMIFLTSNLGAKKLDEAMGDGWGLARNTVMSSSGVLGDSAARSITDRAVKAKFTPEFINRLDETLLFSSLTRDDFRVILGARVEDFNAQLEKRLEALALPYAPYVTLTEGAEEWLLDRGFSREYGARELKRVLFRSVRVPVARALREKPEGLYELRGSVWAGELMFGWVKGGE